MDKLKKIPQLGGLGFFVKQAARAVKQGFLNLTDLEIKVEDATNLDPWGPHGQALREITEESFSEDGYKEIMGVLARRLQVIYAVCFF